MAHRIIVESVGKAQPRIAVAVAHGLGMPVDKALRAIYRAPAPLVGALPHADAARLSSMLEEVGLITRVVSDETPIPEPELFDVSIRLLDMATVEQCLAAIANFCACDEARALDLVGTPPGIVLGGVSKSTVEALKRLLPDTGVEVTASNIEAARYVVFPTAQSAALAATIRAAIAAEVGDDEEPGAFPDLDYEASQRLWARFGRTASVRIVNRDFLRFDIWLECRPGGGEAPDLNVLGRLAGIPEEHWHEVLEAAPVYLERSVTYDELASRLQQYAQAGLAVQGDLVTFKLASVSAAAKDTADLVAVLARFGLPPAQGTTWVSPPIAIEKARLLHAVLAARGMAADLSEAQDG